MKNERQNRITRMVLLKPRIDNPQLRTGLRDKRLGPVLEYEENNTIKPSPGQITIWSASELNGK